MSPSFQPAFGLKGTAFLYSTRKCSFLPTWAAVTALPSGLEESNIILGCLVFASRLEVKGLAPASKLRYSSTTPSPAMPTGLERCARHWKKSTKPPPAFSLAISPADLMVLQSDGLVRDAGRYLRTSAFFITFWASCVEASLGMSRSPSWQVSQQPCWANPGTLPSSTISVRRAS